MTKHKKPDDQTRNACCRREIVHTAMTGLVATEVTLEPLLDRLGREL